MFSPIQLTPSTTQDMMISAINENFRQIESENRTKIIKDENGVNRILIGRTQDGRYVMRVSKEGVDVLEAGENDLIFNSDNNLFKIIDSGETTITIPLCAHGSSVTASDLVVFDEPLDNIPLVLAFAFEDSPMSSQTNVHTFGQNIVQAKSVNTTAVTVGYAYSEQMQVSDADIYFQIDKANSTGVAEPQSDLKIKYYLLSETAE